MFRSLLSFAILCCMFAPAMADEAADKVKANPDSVEAINAYMVSQLPKVIEAMQSDPVAADKLLSEVKGVLDSLKTEKEDAKNLLQRAKSAVAFYGTQIELAKVSLADIEKELEAKPDDAKVFNRYTQKVMSELQKAMSGKTEDLEAKLKAVRDRLAKVVAATKDDGVKAAAEAFPRRLAGIERQIESARRLEALVGKAAAPLEVEAWVNGSPVSDSDLKGKVVLLDFWAVWCGPCIATFPHLIEWNKEYGDKGLVIVGLTNYYKYEWDEAANRASRAKDVEKVTKESEQDMLKKFAALHKLTHRFAVQPDGSKLSEYYAVSGIPHVVLIDRSSKVRMVKVGSGPANAKAISEMLEKLIAEK